MLTLHRSFTIAFLALILKGLSMVLPSNTWGIGSLIGPVTGFFMSPLNCFFLWSLRAGLSLISGVGTVFFLPALAGTLVLSTRSRAVTITIPLICMMVFLANPIGYQSMLYTLYWLIPMGIGLLVPSNIFLWSLASTFTTHAVGSVFYLYTNPTTSLFWHTLIAQVWYERMLYAILLTLGYYAISALLRLTGTNILRTEGNECHGSLNQLPSL